MKGHSIRVENFFVTAQDATVRFYVLAPFTHLELSYFRSLLLMYFLKMLHTLLEIVSHFYLESTNLALLVDQ